MKKIWWNTSVFIKDKFTILIQNLTILPTKGILDIYLQFISFLQHSYRAIIIYIVFLSI